MWTTGAPLLMALLCAPYACAKVITIQNTVPRTDTEGHIMDAHDGKMIFVNGTYYLYGTTYKSCDGSAPCQFNATFSCYATTDLTRWTLLSNDILPYSDPRNRAGHKNNAPQYGPGVSFVQNHPFTEHN